MDWTERRERFRAILAGNRCILPASVYDGISARIAEELGFEVGMFAGSVGSFSVLARPISCVLTLTEFAAQAHRICRAGNRCRCWSTPTTATATRSTCSRTVEELETAGVSAMSIEDTLLPRPFGGDGKPQLLTRSRRASAR